LIRTLFAALIALACIPTVAAQEPAPYDVRVELSFARASGDEGMRDELELQLLSELRRTGCFRSIAKATDADPGPNGETLTLNIVVTELFEETTYDTSIAQRADPLAPDQLELLHTSRVIAVLSVALEHSASGRALRSKRLRGAGAHRPRVRGDDARHAALRQATAEAALAVRRFVCKGGAKRLRKEIEAAPR